MTGGKRGGLGRGLSSLIPTSETTELQELGTQERLLRSLVDAGFALIDEVSTVDFGAYLHVGHGADPVFFLHRPAFGTLTPTTAFRLFHQVGQLSNSTERVGTFALHDWTGVYYRSSGEASDGLHLFAAETEPDQESQALMVARTKAVASVIHQVESADDNSDLPDIRLVAEVEQAKTTIEATITTASGQLLHGRCSALVPDEAVVGAVLDATENDSVLVEVREVPVDDRRAVLTTLRRPDGRASFGLAIGGPDNLTSTACSALRAIR